MPSSRLLNRLPIFIQCKPIPKREIMTCHSPSVRNEKVQRLVTEFERNPIACNQAKAKLLESDGAETVLRIARRAMHDAQLQVCASELLEAAACVAADLEKTKLPQGDGAEMALRIAHRAMDDSKLRLSTSELLQTAARVAADLEASRY
jgi:hypothetical protein